MVYLKHRNAADRKALLVATYLTIHPNATLQRIANHFDKSSTWAKMYKDRALSGETEWQWLKPIDWEKGDHVHTIDHTLKVTYTGRTDHNIWTYEIRKDKRRFGRKTNLQVFSEWSDRKWPVTRAELVRKP